MSASACAWLQGRFPNLYHMTAAGGWDGIRAHGLLSTTALLDLHGIYGPERQPIEAARRAASVVLDAPGKPLAVIRDQRPLSDRALEHCLQDGLTPSDWYRLLNGQVFFWPTRRRLDGLLRAVTYRTAAHDVIEVETRALLAAHAERLWLCPINSGNTRRRPRPRGRATFRRIADHPRDESVAEVALDGGVLDVARFVRRVVREGGGRSPEVIFETA